VEEFLEGEELSLLALCDGERAVPMAPAQDYKRIFDGDRGPNTGGMGSYSPVAGVDAQRAAQITRIVHQPVVDELRRRGTPFHGVLYAGLMLTDDGPKVIEFNVRFGDPEAQVILPMLDEELSWLLASAATGALPSRPAKFGSDVHVGVVMAAGGYPDTVETGKTIDGLEAAARVPGAVIFHAGTSRQDGRIVTSGGRVLTVVGRGPSYRDAIDTAYAAVSQITFEGMQFRRDIGQKA